MLSVWPRALTHPLIRPRALESGKGSRADDGRGRRECAQLETVDRGVFQVLKQLDPQEPWGWPWLNLPDLFQVEVSL